MTECICFKDGFRENISEEGAFVLTHMTTGVETYEFFRAERTLGAKARRLEKAGLVPRIERSQGDKLSERERRKCQIVR